VSSVTLPSRPRNSDDTRRGKHEAVNSQGAAAPRLSPAHVSRPLQGFICNKRVGSVDVQFGRLRKKTQPDEASPQLIRTERGAGYVFTSAVEIVR
jgi:hypothetical protein